MKKLLLLSLFLLAGVAQAASPVTVRDAWIRAMPPAAKNSAGYLVIENRGTEDDELVGATIDGAETTELHEMVHEGHAMAMRQRSSISVPAGGVVELKPGGMHLMLINLQWPLVSDERRYIVLRFRRAGGIQVESTVRAH